MLSEVCFLLIFIISFRAVTLSNCVYLGSYQPSGASSTMAVVDIHIALVYSLHCSLSVTDSKVSAHGPNSWPQLGGTGLIGGLTEDQWGRSSG